MCLYYCCVNDDVNDDVEKQRCWITILIMGIIAAIVFGNIVYRAMKHKNEPYRRISEETGFEKIANRMEYNENKLSNTANQASGVTALAESSICTESGRYSGSFAYDSHSSIPQNIFSKILEAGGSAVDACIAMLFCQGVTEPQHSGLGGGFLMLIYIHKTKKVITLDARATAPSLAMPRMFDGLSREDNENINTEERQGWLTAAVPGEALGLWEAHKKFGNLPWTRLVEPAIHLASQGYAVGKNLATYLALYKDILQKDLTTRKLFFNPITNSTYNEGDVATNPKLAKVLKRIANEGVEYLYRGDVAQSAADESLAGAGIFTLNDFLEYKVKWSYALPCNLKDSNNNGFTLHMPSPPSAAIMVGMILNILQQNEVTLAEANISAGSQLAQFYHIIIEAMKHTFARKFRFGDSSSSPTSELYKYLSHHWGLKIRQLIQTSHTFSQSHYIKQAGSSKTEDLGTTNVAAIAENGDAVVASSTLNDPFGAAIIPTTLGFFLNNNMLTFTPTNDRVSTNNDSSNWIIPEKRPFTYLCPIIVLDSNKNFKLLIGAGAGGARIPTTTALMLIRYFWLNIDIKQNIEMNRFHHQLNPDIVLYESRPNNTSYDIEYLENYGHTLNTTIKKWPHVQVIVRENGENIKFTDSREYV